MMYLLKNVKRFLQYRHMIFEKINDIERKETVLHHNST